MSQISELIQSLSPGAEVELIEFDLSPITRTNTPGDHFYFHAGTNKLNGPVVWQGKTYQAYPIEATGFDLTTRGTMPRPNIRLANVSGLLTAANDQLDDLVGATVIRRRTFACYLDAVNFPAGNPTADPNQHLPDDIYSIERKLQSNNLYVEYELAASTDLEGFQLPARSIVANYCPWRYRAYRSGAFDYEGVGDCPYTGSNYFTSSDTPTTDPTKDVCSKTLNGCKVRFGTAAILPFGGFPAAKAYKL